jgi:phosphatidylserine/phosphatidylglycerophosphate/cardiolipin synthase-like enzyme
MKSIRSIAALTLAAVTVGCASSLPGPTPMMGMPPAQMMRQSAVAAPGAAAQPFTVHFVQAYKGPIAENEPLTRRDPNGPAAALIQLINTARKSLDGAFYDFSDENIAEAFIQAKKRGVQVRLITDNENMTVRDSGPQGPVRPHIARMQQAGIPVIDDKRSGLMHHKFLVQDGQTVWMGSTNLTPTSLYQHNNNAMTLRVPQVAANYTYEFERMFVQGIFGPNPPRQLPFPVVQVGNSTIRTFFSPRGGGQEAVVDTLKQAKKDVAFMTFSFTDKEIGAIMVAKRQAGLRVEGVFDQCLGFGKFSQYHTLKAANIFSRMDGNQALLHHKILLVDDTVITGSYNFSANADKSNNENVLLIQNTYVSSMYRQEYARIMQAAKTNNPPRGECPGDKPAAPGAPSPEVPATP